MKVQCNVKDRWCRITESPPELMVLADIANGYLAKQMKQGYSFYTVRLRAFMLKKYFDFLQFKKKNIEKTDIKIVKTYFEWLAKNSSLDRASINKYWSCAVDFTNYAAVIKGEKNRFAYNLPNYFIIPRRRKPQNNVFDQKQIVEFIESAKNVRDYFLLFLLYETGMRISEALSLYLEDIDLADRTIRITDRGLLQNGASIKTSSSVRSIVCSQELMEALNLYLFTYAEIGDASPHLFIKIKGARKYEPMTYTDVDNLFRSLRKETGVGLTPHSFRHASLSILNSAGWNLELVAKRAGHASAETTSKYYIHKNSDEITYCFNNLLAKLSPPDYLSHINIETAI